MELSELTFAPHSDVGANEIDIVNQHKNLINSGNYSDATALLNNGTSILSDISIRYSPTIPLASPIFS